MAKRSGSGITNSGGGGSVSAGGSSTPAWKQAAQQFQQQQAQQNAQPQNTAQQPAPQNVAPTQTKSAFDTLRGMNDDQLADVVNKSKTVDMPNQISDVSDVTQRFVYQANLNDKPQVLDSADFNKFMSDNNLGTSDLLSRDVKPINYTNNSGTKVHLTDTQVANMMMYSKLNYIGGKVGGQAYGAGTYFDHVGGQSTGYGSKTVVAVLNPKTARPISESNLRRQATSFAKSHPKFASAVGAFNSSFSGGKNNMAIYALAMGYNVITDGSNSGYINVIDRAALVYRA